MPSLGLSRMRPEGSRVGHTCAAAGGRGALPGRGASAGRALSPTSSQPPTGGPLSDQERCPGLERGRKADRRRPGPAPPRPVPLRFALMERHRHLLSLRPSCNWPTPPGPWESGRGD